MLCSRQIQTTGKRILPTMSNGLAVKREIFSLCLMLIDLGVISPKTRIKNVKTPVTIPIALLPKDSTAHNVASTEAKIFTRLLPINMVISSLWGLLFSFTIARLPNLLSLPMARTLAGDSAVKAISAPEKAPERKIRKNRMTRHKKLKLLLQHHVLQN